MYTLFFFQAEDGIRDVAVTGVQTCALPIFVENHTELLDSVVTIGFDSKDCDADYRMITSRGAEPIEAPQDRPWDARTAYVKGPGGLTVEIEQLLSDTSR